MTTFNEWWQADENLWVHTRLTKSIAEAAYNKATQEERRRCLELINERLNEFAGSAHDWKERSECLEPINRRLNEYMADIVCETPSHCETATITFTALCEAYKQLLTDIENTN